MNRRGSSSAPPRHQGHHGRREKWLGGALLDRVPCRVLHRWLSRWVIHHFSPHFTAIRHEAYSYPDAVSTRWHMMWVPLVSVFCVRAEDVVMQPRSHPRSGVSAPTEEICEAVVGIGGDPDHQPPARPFRGDARGTLGPAGSLARQLAWSVTSGGCSSAPRGALSLRGTVCITSAWSVYQHTLSPRSIQSGGLPYSGSAKTFGPSILTDGKNTPGAPPRAWDMAGQALRPPQYGN